MGRPNTRDFEMARTAKAKKGSAAGWMIFLATLLVPSFAAMPGFDQYSVVADRATIAVRLTLVLTLSILVVRERFSADTRVDKSSSPLQRCRHWFYDD
jgi:hypothetical protein